MNKARVCGGIAASCVAAWALVTAYHVEPRTAAMSGWTRLHAPGDTVSEVITVNFDELDSTSGAYCELFGGSRGAGGAYHVSVLTYPGGAPVASGEFRGHNTK